MTPSYDPRRNDLVNLPRIEHRVNKDDENHREHERHKANRHERFPLVVFVPFVVLFVRTTNIEFARGLRGF